MRLVWKQGRSPYYIEAGDYTVARTHDQHGARYHAWVKPPAGSGPHAQWQAITPGTGRGTAKEAQADAQAHADAAGGAGA